MAFSGLRAGGIFIQTYRVGRSRFGSNPIDPVFYGADDFVHSGNDNYVLRTGTKTGDPVAETVDVDEFAVMVMALVLMR